MKTSLKLLASLMLVLSLSSTQALTLSATKNARLVYENCDSFSIGPIGPCGFVVGPSDPVCCYRVVD